MPNYRVTCWTIIEANSVAEAIAYFLSNIDENSIDVEIEEE